MCDLALHFFKKTFGSLFMFHVIGVVHAYPLQNCLNDYYFQGYFQALFSCIERLLCSLNVENLVLPAAEDAESIWTKKLGFQKMSEDRVSALFNPRQFFLTYVHELLRK